jgi:hypothetical protein
MPESRTPEHRPERPGGPPWAARRGRGRRWGRGAGGVGGVGGSADGYALKLTGAGADYAEIGPMAKVTSDAATFEAWIQLPPGATAPQTILLVEGAVPRISVGGDQLGVFWEPSQQGPGYGSRDTTPVTDGRWHHIAVVFDRGTLTFFKDGKPLDSTAMRAPQTSGDSLQVGAALGSTGTFNGLIYDIRVWNVARKAADIAGSMLSILTGKEPGLVALCNFPGGKVGNQVNGAPGFTTGAAQVVPTSIPHISTLPSAALAQEMHQQNLSLTRRWDVVSVMDADRVNYLFGQQFVGNLQTDQHFEPVSGPVPLVDNTTVVFTDILLSYPLIEFSASAAAASVRSTWSEAAWT